VEATAKPSLEPELSADEPRLVTSVCNSTRESLFNAGRMPTLPKDPAPITPTTQRALATLFLVLRTIE